MLEAIEADPGALAARRGVGGAHARVGGRLRAHHRAVEEPDRARRGAARRRARSAACWCRTASTRAPSTRCEVDRHAHWRHYLVDEPRGWAPGERPGLGALRRGRPRGVRGRGRPDAGAPVRRALHGGQTPAAADRGVRERPAGVRAPGAAGAGGRLPGRVGGRAPAGRDPAHRRSGRVPGRLARARRAALVPRRLRRRRAPVRARAVRSGARGGDGVRPARDRRRRLGTGRHRQARRDGLARRAGRPRLARQRARLRRQLPATSAPAAASARPPRRASATRGRPWPRTSPRPTTPRAAPPMASCWAPGRSPTRR